MLILLLKLIITKYLKILVTVQIKKNKLDFRIASTELKTPFVLYIHGGGFGSGNKNGLLIQG